jgi:hypothetical protein
MPLSTMPGAKMPPCDKTTGSHSELNIEGMADETVTLCKTREPRLASRGCIFGFHPLR